MELNRGGVGVPLHKLASVVDEAQKFFRMLGEDVHIDNGSGVWLGCDFDSKSLNFTAEYVGPVEPAQIREFYAAFDGVTLLRRATIAQFARIANSIDEDELIGFGLYQNDQESEPDEWRSLSKLEALRITEEIRLLLDRAGGDDVESRIPAALDSSAGATSVFRDRREHGGLAERMTRLENEVNRHNEEIQSLRGNTANTEKNLQNLLVAVDTFCDRASRQMEKLPPRSLLHGRARNLLAYCGDSRRPGRTRRIGAIFRLSGTQNFGQPCAGRRSSPQKAPAVAAKVPAPSPAPSNSTHRPDQSSENRHQSQRGRLGQYFRKR